uniref:Ribosomal protein L34e superfamily protein n=1 Tax=Noccaea caerulescens TaxID=107243 RepID=A0A1J3HE72_NOCCA
MVYFQSSISVVDQSPITMANSADFHHQKPRSNRKPTSCSNFPICCDGSRSAAIDVLILIAVITSSGFLIFPYIKFIAVKSVEIFSELSCLAKEEIIRNPDPIVYGLIALSISCTALSAWMIVILLCSRHKCGKPNCKGLRKANAEFDIQLETEDCVKSSGNGSSGGKSVSKKGLFELPRDHHRELEAELKKMAPPNGRAVLVFRAKCGCSVGRLEVPGPKKQQQQQRKIKK